LPSTTEKQKKFFELVLRCKQGKIPKNKLHSSVVKASNGMTEEQIRDV